MPTLITNENPEDFGWKHRRQDRKTELFWKNNPPRNGQEEYQKKWNFIETDYDHEPSNNGFDLSSPAFAFDKKLVRYIKVENKL